jgi:hypothetical protein
MKSQNLQNMTVTTASFTDVKNTQQLKGEAKESAAFRETNQTKEYSSGSSGKGPGPFGGMNSGS